jgi:aspartate kinase
VELIVLKFGGTSISNREGFSKSLQHIKKELILKNKVICVVSAMGRDESPYATDTLKNLLKNYVSKKEQDRLLSIGEIISSILFTDYLIENQINALSLSTKEIGIITNNKFTDADIINIKNNDLLNKLLDYDVLVIPGFQGLTINDEVTTLGRGGSDTTAIALGIALNAKRVDIISDVKGVYTADPQIVDTALKIPKLSYDVLFRMTQNGSKVLHDKGALLANKYQIPLRFVAIDDYNSYTSVEDTQVDVINLSYKNGYLKYSLSEKINDPNVYMINDCYYLTKDYEEKWQQKLLNHNIKYEKLAGFSKITLIKSKQEEYYFVESNLVKQKLNDLHKKIFHTG